MDLNRLAYAVVLAALATGAAAQAADRPICVRAAQGEGYVASTAFDEAAYDLVMAPIYTAYREEGEAAADTMLGDMLAKWRRDTGPTSVQFARTVYEQGRVDLLHDRDEQAITHFDEAIALFRANPDTPPHYLVLALQDRASAAIGLQQLDAADRDSHEAAELAQTLYPMTDRALVNALTSRAGTLTSRHRQAEGARIYRLALACALESEELTPDFAAGIVSSMVANLTMHEGRAQTSLALIDEAIARLRGWDGNSARAESRLLAAKSSALGQLERHEEAAETMAEAIALASTLFDKPGGAEAQDYINVAIYRHNLARTFHEIGRHEEAKTELDLMAATMDERLPDSHPVHIFTDRQRALNLIEIGETEAGERLLRERYQDFAKLVPPTELRLVAWQADLGERALAAGRAQEAQAYYALAAQGVEQRIAARQIDAVVAEREWDGQRDVYMGLVRASAMLADAF